MATTVQFEWTWTGYVGAAFLGEPDISVTADVHSDGEVHVTGVSIIDTPTTQVDGKWVRGKQQIVSLDDAHDAFSLALFAKIKADLETEKGFIEKAIDHAADDGEGDFYMSGGRKHCPDQWREEQLDRQSA